MQPQLPEPTPLQPDSWRAVIGQLCQDLIEEKKQVILCVTGKSGSGKSTLGRKLRKQGLPGIPPRKIAVIDDGVLAVPLLGFFTRRIKSKSRERDNLASFAHFLKNKPLVVYVNVTPHLRLDHCDVVLRLRCPEEERRERLILREKHGEARFDRTLNASDAVCIQADHVFDLCLVATHDRQPSACPPSVTSCLPFLYETGPHLTNWAAGAAECC